MSGTSVEMRRTAENALSSVFSQHCLLPVVNICFLSKCAVLKIEFPRNKYTKEIQLRSWEEGMQILKKQPKTAVKMQYEFVF